MNIQSYAESWCGQAPYHPSGIEFPAYRSALDFPGTPRAERAKAWLEACQKGRLGIHSAEAMRIAEEEHRRMGCAKCGCPEGTDPNYFASGNHS